MYKQSSDDSNPPRFKRASWAYRNKEELNSFKNTTNFGRVIFDMHGSDDNGDRSNASQSSFTTPSHTFTNESILNINSTSYVEPSFNNSSSFFDSNNISNDLNAAKSSITTSLHIKQSLLNAILTEETNFFSGCSDENFSNYSFSDSDDNTDCSNATKSSITTPPHNFTNESTLYEKSPSYIELIRSVYLIQQKLSFDDHDFNDSGSDSNDNVDRLNATQSSITTSPHNFNNESNLNEESLFNNYPSSDEHDSNDSNDSDSFSDSFSDSDDNVDRLSTTQSDRVTAHNYNKSLIKYPNCFQGKFVLDGFDEPDSDEPDSDEPDYVKNDFHEFDFGELDSDKHDFDEYDFVTTDSDTLTLKSLDSEDEELASDIGHSYRKLHMS